jgi:hypothetical protein
MRITQMAANELAPEPNPGAEALSFAGAEQRELLLIRRLALALLLVGVLWRIWRYLLSFPIWGDEAMLCLNFQEFGYFELTRQLRYCQVAPLLFLWGELTALHLLGGSPLAMHVLPFLAGLGSLFLFWRLSRLTLPPLAAMLALGFLAVAVWPVSMGALAKPYSFDLLMALALLVPAAHWLEQPRPKWLILLCLIAPIAAWGSYPVIFVGGGISIALLPSIWRDRRPTVRWLLVAYSTILAASFLGHYLIVGRGLLQSPAGTVTTEAGMRSYWADGFPPSAPLPLLKWLVLTHTGQMTAYPVGASSGGSTLTVLLCLLGAFQFWKAQRRALLMLCAAPFALWLIAAALYCYPYGASCRLSQHVAPMVCLTAGMGAAALIERVRSAAGRRRWIIGVCSVFFLVGAGGMVRDAIKPYRDQETLWVAQEMGGLAARARSGAAIVVLNQPEEVELLFRWYLGLQGDRVSWGGKIDWQRARASGEVLCVRFRELRLMAPDQLRSVHTLEPAVAPANIEAQFRECEGNWRLRAAFTDTGVPSRWSDPVRQVDQYCWILN